eukprot:jgi/Botrbrau1/7882/Bobra.9_2s0056.1
MFQRFCNVLWRNHCFPEIVFDRILSWLHVYAQMRIYVKRNNMYNACIVQQALTLDCISYWLHVNAQMRIYVKSNSQGMHVQLCACPLMVSGAVMPISKQLMAHSRIPLAWLQVYFQVELTCVGTVIGNPMLFLQLWHALQGDRNGLIVQSIYHSTADVAVSAEHLQKSSS